MRWPVPGIANDAEPGHYPGTMSGKSLQQEFSDTGFVVIRNAVSAADIRSLREAAARIVDDFDIDRQRSVFSTLHEDRDRDQYFLDSAEAVHCFLEEDALDDEGRLIRDKELAINKIGHAMHDLVPEFANFCRLPVFRDTLESIGLPHPQLWQTMYIFKQPQIGGEVRWHQDASYLIADEPGVVGCWVALEDADRSNGCLWMQPRGHRSPLREVFEVEPGSPTGVLRKLDSTAWPDASSAIPMEVGTGSVVFFSDHMPHYSSQNLSDHSRHAFTMHLSNAGSHWSKKNWLQRPNLEPFLLQR